MPLEQRVRNTFKVEKRRMYAISAIRGVEPDINDVLLYVCKKFKLTCAEVKEIINPGQKYFGGGPDGTE